KPVSLIKGIAAALRFSNEEDPSSVKLQEMIQEKGLEKAVAQVTGLESDHSLLQAIIKEMESRD
ncbi:MAG TPA: mannitol-1-phosphate 5-dehydrogenase, partial [Eubacteriaceae bacterium]|nr:mannitol-1-phosphate 5-dehydrogenase [Eubacteriaceae bacterium]